MALVAMENHGVRIFKDERRESQMPRYSPLGNRDLAALSFVSKRSVTFKGRWRQCFSLVSWRIARSIRYVRILLETICFLARGMRSRYHMGAKTATTCILNFIAKKPNHPGAVVSDLLGLEHSLIWGPNHALGNLTEL